MAAEEKLTMKPFDKCPICGGQLEERTVEKLLRGGVHTAAVRVRADVCMQCGERLYSQQDVERFEDIRAKLQLQQTEGFRLVGQSFEVA
jgi:YgiT-type zinc finger domain-containing protein